MAELILLRHGKSDWEAEPDGDDRRRPLARRGERSARRMGRFLVEAGHLPELAVTSPARRAEDTLRIAQGAGGWEGEVRRSEALYTGGVPGLLEVVGAAPSEVGTLLVVSHEPTCSQAIAVLTGGCRLRFPTAAMACIELEDWPQAGRAGGSLAWFVVPRLWDGDHRHVGGAVGL
jgi:phosphohistidine phosphatase